MRFSTLIAIASSIVCAIGAAIPAIKETPQVHDLEKRGPFCAAGCVPLAPAPPLLAACLLACTAAANADDKVVELGMIVEK
ncbi:hypothetical protein ABW20_dc0106919 [Dactylellina cionopaga]|nr:hypothetical protein ABW20_dc0106919 [Dactylellina cionopaga]